MPSSERILVIGGGIGRAVQVQRSGNYQNLLTVPAHRTPEYGWFLHAGAPCRFGT